MDEILSNVKVVIIGTPSVGKTSLRRTFIGENFRTNYIETIGSDFSFKTVDIKDQTLGIALWDLAGQDRFLSVHPLFYKGSYGCVVVYSVVDRNTFNQVDDWIERFLTNNNRSNLPIMIIGNKIDALNQYEDPVTNEEHLALVKRIRKKYKGHKAIEFRTSAITGENVEEGFTKYGELIYDWIVENLKDGNQSMIYEDDIDANIPSSYALVMNQITGPQIISTDPKVDMSAEEFSRVSNNAIKLIASLDFNDVIQQGSLISSFPWVNPKGIFYYIAFVLDNTRARGNKELFILGVNVNRELSDSIAGIKGVLDGFLHSSINEFARVIIENKVELVTEKIDFPKNEIILKEVGIILQNLRTKTHESLKRWYNIPT